MVKELFSLIFIAPSILLQNNLAYANGLSIPELDPYEIIDHDKKKEQSKYLPKTRSQREKKERIDEILKKGEDIPQSCNSADEFSQTYIFLTKHPEVDFPNRNLIEISYQVSKGCDGSSERFKKVLNLLIKSGVDKKSSVEISIHFSKKSNENTEAFLSIFQGTFLENYMDINFKAALATSLKIALNARGNPETVAKDFRNLLNYCLAHKTGGLSFKTCGPLVLNLAEYSFLYDKESLSESFIKMMTFIESQKEINYSLTQSFKLTLKILKNGPKAVENVLKQYQFGISDQMKLPQKTALELAVKVSESSLKL